MLDMPAMPVMPRRRVPRRAAPTARAHFGAMIPFPGWILDGVMGDGMVMASKVILTSDAHQRAGFQGLKREVR
jgi:hypothetical protein